jgi:nicotinamide riboside kinase
MKDIDDLARSVVSARVELETALRDKRRRPRQEFKQLFLAVTAYVNATASDKMIHRDVAAAVSGLREYLETQGAHAMGDAIFDADRLETMVFAGYDPSFEGDEPPGL